MVYRILCLSLLLSTTSYPMFKKIIPYSSVHQAQPEHYDAEIGMPNIEHEIETISQTVIHTYFKRERIEQGSVHERYLQPSLKKIIKTYAESEDAEHKERYNVLKRYSSGEMSVSHPQDFEKLQDVIIKSVDEAFDKQQKDLEKRWTDKQTAYLTAATAIATSLITAGATLMATYNQNSDNN